MLSEKAKQELRTLYDEIDECITNIVHSRIHHDENAEGLAEEDNPFDDNIPLPDSFVERMVHKIADSELFNAEPLDIPTMTTDFVKGHGLPCPDGYEFRDENGNVIEAKKIVLEKKKPKYPKSYEECCVILGIIGNNPPWHGPRSVQLKIFQKLLICRDAYWKLAGDWMPDWLDDDTIKWCICHNKRFHSRGGLGYTPYPFAFPTEEMRDAFYENFKDLIEACKELL